MNKYLLGGLIIAILACFGLGWFGVHQYGNRIKAEEQVATLTETNNSLQDYIIQKDKAYQKLNIKYSEMRKTKPADDCGDSQVSEDILNWLRNDNQGE